MGLEACPSPFRRLQRYEKAWRSRRSVKAREGLRRQRLTRLHRHRHQSQQRQPRHRVAQPAASVPEQPRRRVGQRRRNDRWAEIVDRIVLGDAGLAATLIFRVPCRVQRKRLQINRLTTSRATVSIRVGAASTSDKSQDARTHARSRLLRVSCMAIARDLV